MDRNLKSIPLNLVRHFTCHLEVNSFLSTQNSIAFFSDEFHPLRLGRWWSESTGGRGFGPYAQSLGKGLIKEYLHESFSSFVFSLLFFLSSFFWGGGDSYAVMSNRLYNHLSCCKPKGNKTYSQPMVLASMSSHLHTPLFLSSLETILCGVLCFAICYHEYETTKPVNELKGWFNEMKTYFDKVKSQRKCWNQRCEHFGRNLKRYQRDKISCVFFINSPASVASIKHSWKNHDPEFDKSWYDLKSMKRKVKYRSIELPQN